MEYDNNVVTWGNILSQTWERSELFIYFLIQENAFAADVMRFTVGIRFYFLRKTVCYDVSSEYSLLSNFNI